MVDEIYDRLGGEEDKPEDDRQVETPSDFRFVQLRLRTVLVQQTNLRLVDERPRG